MNPKLKALCDNLKQKIVDGYETDITVEDAQKLAGEFLAAQMSISDAIRIADMDARMRKVGVKSIRGAVYNDIIAKSEGKKPTVDSLEHSLNTDDIVIKSQTDLDEAEAERDDLKRYFDIFHEGHIYYRAIGKGIFG